MTLDKMLHERVFNLARAKIRTYYKHKSEVEKDIEDVVNDTLMSIYKQYKNKIIPEDEFIKWVMGIAWKTICLYFRKQNQFYNLYNTMDGFVLDEISPYISDNSINPKVLVDNWDIENIISNALKKMKKPYAEVLRALLKGEIKKYTTEQKKRNVNMDKVYTRISRCRAQMRDLLIQAGFELNF